MDPIKAGVVGVGAMGENHARIYAELGETELVGVADADEQAARDTAARYDTVSRDWDDLLDEVDAMSIAVPTEYHYDLAKDCIEAGVPVLVEKPFVEHQERGQELVELARENWVPIQVGHVERFNPAVDVLRRYVQDLDVIALSAQRCNPPPSRDIDDSAVMDLMIHDLDVIISLVDAPVQDVSSLHTRGGRYATAELKFGDGTIGQLTASRVSQRRVRELTVTAEQCLVHVDYDTQTVEVHERPADAHAPGEEKVVKQLVVDEGEPLKRELRSFADVARNGGTPVVTGSDGLRVVELAHRLERREIAPPSAGDA